MGGKRVENACFSTAFTCGMSASRSGRTEKGMAATVGSEVTVFTAVYENSSIAGLRIRSMRPNLLELLLTGICYSRYEERGLRLTELKLPPYHSCP